ncbi:interleukin-6 receptor subunit alpha [Hyla sarda]|uniref:interleukin-6 receptor subunit alpha n=1 Tax=Hyla sarda TaxID=327740 RepID=UPI0024C343B8|nr:interleukin-6 receptor subunit alpha [Hyla sarda]
MGGICRRWCLLILVVSCRPSSSSNGPETLCPKPAAPEDAILVSLHSAVNLTCVGCEGSVSWRHRSPPGSPRHLEGTQSGGHLVVDPVTYEDEGGYTCYKDGAPVCSVELMVKDELQDNAPLLCYHRYPTHNITCEWTPSKLLHPSSNVTLVVLRNLRDPTFYPCTYSAPRQTFSCSSLYTEGDESNHAFYLCVNGRTDSTLAANLDAYGKDLLHVEPPLNVRVTPVQNHPRRLRVSWSRPRFWEETFYHLIYQVLYGVENSPHPSNGTTSAQSFLIEDAVMGSKHLIRVRAREEFQKNWGSWSEEAAGTPWSEEATTTWVPTEYDPPTSEEEEDPIGEEKTSAPVVSFPRISWLAPCVSLGLVLLIFFGIWIRYQEIQILKLQWGLVRSLFHSSSKVKSPQPQASASLLMAPCSSPPSVTVTVPPLLGKE